jgi:hypothetical protein
VAVAQVQNGSNKATTATNTISVTLGAAPTNGNMLLALFATNGGTPTLNTPTGWTRQAANTTGNANENVYLYYKWASSDSATVTFTTTGNFTTAGLTVIELSGVAGGGAGSPFSLTPLYLSSATTTASLLFTNGLTIGSTGSYMMSMMAGVGGGTGQASFASSNPGGSFTVSTIVSGNATTTFTTTNLLLLGTNTTSSTTWSWGTQRTAGAYVFAIKAKVIATATATESIATLTDSITQRKSTETRVVTETMTSMSESLTRGSLALSRSVSDTISTLLEQVTTAVKRTPNESMTTLTDAAAAAAAVRSRAASDTISTLTDSATRIASIAKTVTENVSTLNDAASGKSKVGGVGYDSITPLTDADARQVLLPRTVVENMHYLNEVVNIARSALRGVAENMTTMTEATKAGKVYHVSAADVISHLSETVAFYSIHSRSTGGETMTISDAAGRLTHLTRVAGETMYYYDTTSRVVIYRTIRVWNGTRWVPAIARVWDGSQWAITKPHNYTDQGWSN